MGLYDVYVTVNVQFDIEADSYEEAEELALDEFMALQDWWDVDFDIHLLEEDED